MQQQWQKQQPQASNVQLDTQEMEKLKKESHATNVEKERSQAQLDMEKSQVSNEKHYHSFVIMPMYKEGKGIIILYEGIQKFSNSHRSG